MPLHVAARMHAFVHGLFRPADEWETRKLYEEVECLFARHGLGDDAARDEVVATLTTEVLASFGLAADHRQRKPVKRLIGRIFDYETLFVLPPVDWSRRHSISEYWDIRDALNAQRQLALDLQGTLDLLRDALVALLEPVYANCSMLFDMADGDGITVPTELVHSIALIGQVIDAMLAVPFDDDVKKAGIFTRLVDRLERNVVAASGGNPAAPESFTKTPKLPSKSEIRNPEELVATYLGGTPVAEVFDQALDFVLPTDSRFEHHHIVAGSGHGKTQTLQYLIGKDLEAVERGERTIIVLDSQGDLIRKVSNLACFAPGAPLHERIVVIDPSDVEWPVSLNLFDVGIDRLRGYAPLERERLTNSILELYDFVLGTLLAAEMTQKQNVIFRYVTRLMLHIPDATIHTLRELMEPGSEKRFAADIAKLAGTARHFFESEFASREFEQTKKQVLRRLWGILENQTFERMFSHPRSKLDLFSEMNAGKVVLINTAKDLLKEQGTEIFGRFFIAMIAQAAQERATLPEDRRVPTFVYIDEAADYFDRNIGLILAQARKYNVGMVLAHQYLGQLEPKLQEAVAANTSIKFAGGVSAKDARALAPMLYCEPALIEAQPKGCFAAHVRGVTQAAVPLRFPFGFLEDMPRMTPAERGALQDAMRKRYAVRYADLESERQATSTAAEPERGGATPPRGAEKQGSADTPSTDATEGW